MSLISFVLVVSLGVFMMLLGTLLFSHARSFRSVREVAAPCLIYFGIGVALIWLAVAYAPFSTPWGAA